MAPPGPSFYNPRLIPAGEAPVEGSRKRAREAYLQWGDFWGPQVCALQVKTGDQLLTPRVTVLLAQDRAAMGGHRTGRLPALGQGGLSHEQRLIDTLKRQIAILDSPTRAMLKESLYRISRNTNARVSEAHPGLP